MLITKELIMSLIIVFGIGKISESRAPSYYDIITDDGKLYNIMIEKNVNNACPIHCTIDHYHSSILLDVNELDNEYLYSIVGFGTNGISINSREVIDMEEINIKNNEPQKLKRINVQTYLP